MINIGLGGFKVLLLLEDLLFKLQVVCVRKLSQFIIKYHRKSSKINKKLTCFNC